MRSSEPNRRREREKTGFEWGAAAEDRERREGSNGGGVSRRERESGRGLGFMHQARTRAFFL